MGKRRKIRVKRKKYLKLEDFVEASRHSEMTSQAHVSWLFTRLGLHAGPLGIKIKPYHYHYHYYGGGGTWDTKIEAESLRRLVERAADLTPERRVARIGPKSMELLKMVLELHDNPIDYDSAD